MAWCIIRVRGSIHARHDIRQTLDELHLRRANHATVVPESASFRGMITKVQGYVTWGEIDAPTLETLLRDRAQTPEGARLAADAKVGELAQAVATGGLRAASEIRPLFRLKAPKGGWRSTKRPFARGGALGYRGPAINELARRMV